MPRSYAFISYSRADRNYVEALAAYLGNSGTSVWFDYEIVTGDRFEKVIRERIDNCEAFIVVMTPAVERSEWVALEIARARQKGKRILPLLLAGDPMFALGTLSYTDVTDGIMPNAEFVNALTALLDVPKEGVQVDGIDTRPPSGVFDYLARHRPSKTNVQTELRVSRHVASDVVHEILIAAVLVETLYSWPEGTMFVVDYGPDAYAQGTFHGETLMTEIGNVQVARLAQAEQMGWINPAGPAKDDEEYDSRTIWSENPVMEWNYKHEPLANVAAFVARGVERVLNVDPSEGYSIQIFHNNDPVAAVNQALDSFITSGRSHSNDQDDIGAGTEWAT